MNAKLIAIATITLAAATVSCKKGCTDPTAENYDSKAKKNNGTCTYATTYDIPSTYIFTDENGNNTVSYGGQYQRLDMLSEMVTYMKTADSAGVAIDAQTLKNMYANNSYSWIDANGLGMTGSSKQLKSKTAGGDAGIQEIFETYMDDMAALSATTVNGQEDGTAGTGGVWPKDEKGPYLMSGTGHEYTQLIEKGLMCAVFMNQMTDNYLVDMDADDNTSAVDAAAGKHYTTMEHHWDEAFGYFTTAVDFPSNGTDRFWGKYANGREVLLGSSTKIITAFRTGRAAISNDDYSVRDEQITIIRNEMEKLCAGTAIHYLNDAKEYITSATARNHCLSEAQAFLDGLRFGYNATHSVGMTGTQIDAALAHFSADYNAVTLTDIQNAIDAIAANTGLESLKGDL